MSHKLAILALSANGYDREDAVRTLARTRDGSELPHLLPRLNDWVFQVREAAKAAIVERLTPDYAEHFARNLWLITRLEDARRADHRPLLDEITRLMSVHARPALIAAMSEGPPPVRRAAFRVLTAGGAGDEILEIALRSDDAFIRLWAVQRLSPERLRDLMNDPAASARGEVVRRSIAAFPTEAIGILRTALLDRSPSIRDEARFELRRRSHDDSANVYREALSASTPARLAVAIDGLGESGTAADADGLRVYLAHESTRVRRAAVRAIARLSGDRCVDAISEMIVDPAPVVSAQTRKALVRHAAVLDATRLVALLSNATSTHARRNLIAVIAALPKWESIVCLLQAADESATQFIERWLVYYNRSQTTPSPAQLASLERAMADERLHLDADTMAELRFIAASFRR